MSGFTSPNHTQTPNDLFDTLMKDMGESELKVVLAAIRQTLGYHKTKDPISLSRFESLTGLSRQSVIDGVDKAINRGVLRIAGTGKRGVHIFELVIILDQSSELTSTSQNSRPVNASTSQNSRHTKEKESKQNTEKKKTTRAPKKTEREILIDQLQPHLALAHEILTAHEPGYRGMYTSILEYCTAYDALKEWTDVVIGLSERRSPPRPGEFASYYRDLTTYYAARQWQVGRKTIREQWDNWRAGKFSPGGSAGTSDWQITPAPALPDVGLSKEDRQQMVESTRKQRIGGV